MIGLNRSSKRYTFSDLRERLFNVQKQVYGYSDSVKKNTGAYYTPQYVVNYIVSKTIYSSLLNKINEKLNQSKKIIDFNNIWQTNKKTLISYLYEQILPSFSVCDIAMGWGIFLLSAFDILFKIYIKCLQSLTNLSKDDLEENKEKITYDIITRNLYGADVSPEAIELAQLKMYEKIFAILNKQEIQLPRDNFVVGNSLIGFSFLDYFITDKSNPDRIWKEGVIGSLNKKNKEQAKQWLDKQKFIHWNRLFPKISDSGGFDVIVGNPPYVNVKRLPIGERKVYANIYQTYNSNGDFSNIFWERALTLVKTSGFVSFITPRYWLEGSDSNLLRNFILKNSTIKEIVDFGSNRTLFVQTENNLGVDTAIITIKKGIENSNIFYVFVLDSNKKLFSIDKSIFTKKAVKQSVLTDSRWNFDLPPLIQYIEEISSYRLGDDKKHKRFSGICLIGKGCSTGNNRIFKLTKIKKGLFKGYNDIQLALPLSEHSALRRLIKNSDVSNYCLRERKQYWIFLKNKDINDFPVIKSYLDQFKEHLEKTRQKYGLKNYYDYAVYRSLSLIDHIPKIVTPYQSERNKFAIIDKQTLPTINEADVITLTIKPQFSSKFDWYYLVAILNSALIHYYVKNRNKQIYYLYDFRTNQIANFPIRHSSIQPLVVKLSKSLKNICSKGLSNTIYQKLYRDIDLLLNNLIFEIYFKEKLSSELAESINSDLINLNLECDTDPKKTSIKLQEILSENSIKKNIQKIYSIPEVQEIHKNSYLTKYL